MRILTADADPHSRIWLWGVEVSADCCTAYVPDKPGRLGWGWADLLVGHTERFHGMHVHVARAGPDGQPIIRRHWGLVRWEPDRR
jgi:hypothetical protein